MACYSRIVHASLLFGISFCTLTGCQNRANTAELLEANFVASGKTAIDLLSPTQDQQVASSNPTFSWGDRGAGLYTLEIASDANFQNMVLKKSVNDTQYTLANADLSGVSALTTNSYHWRVKIANVSNNLQSKTGTFFLVAMPSGGSGSAGVLYVNTASSSSVEIGSKEKPYKRIQAAIANADALRNYQFGVTMDIYVAQGSYTEEVILSPGISVRGGYEATNWTRNTATNTTTINAPLTFAVRGSTSITTTYTNTTWLEGFTLRGATRSTSYLLMATVDLQGTSPTIAYNTIVAGTSSGSPTQQNMSALDAGTDSPVILGNVIIAAETNCGGCNYVHAINTAGSTIIVNNLISGGAQSSSVARGITLGSASTALVLNNTIEGAAVNNTNAAAIYMENTAHPTIRNNVVFTKQNAPLCIRAETAARPTALQNNNIFGCTNLYYDGSTNATAANFASQAVNMTAGSGTLQSYGNVNIDDNAGQLFVDYDGADNNASTVADNNLRLTTNAAICNVRGGGLNLGSNTTIDKDSITRTITTIAGCTTTNTGATNWSIGAFERD